MKKFIYIGPERTGKSTTIISTGSILAKLGKNVLIQDSTRSQGLYSCFEYNSDIEKESNIVRENCDIKMTNPLESLNGFNFDKLNRIDTSNYDYVLIEADQYFDIELLADAEKIFLFQDGDKHTLLKNKFIIDKMKGINELDKKIVVVFSTFYDAKFDISYFVTELNSKQNIIKNNFVEIPFDDVDVINILENKLNGNVNLKNMTAEYKAAIYSIINEFEEVTEKQFRKLIR